MSVDVALLKKQRSTVISGMSNSRQQISILSDKISRLQAASSNLQSSIAELETSKNNINNLSIDNSKWEGSKENKFSNHYSDYRTSVRNYLQSVNDAKEGIDEEIRRLEQSKAGYMKGLGNLESTLNSLNNQISRAESR